MMSPAVVDQEFVAHLFVPLEGPQSARAYQQVRRLWTACRETLEMTESITGLSASVLPPEFSQLPLQDVVAAQENPAADRQSVLRRAHDVLNLSVALAQPLPEGLASRPGGRLIRVRSGHGPARRRFNWEDYAQIWSRVDTLDPDVRLGEARLFLARMPPDHGGRVEATAELGEALDSLLPHRADRPRGWWQWGTTTTAGYAVWDTGLADTGAIREIVLVAAADQDSQLSAWAWSDGTASIPPFAQYLLHAAKLRYEARLLDSWHNRAPSTNAGQLVAELSVLLTPEDDHPRKADLLNSLASRLSREELRLANLEAELARLARTVTIAESNLTAIPGCEADRRFEGLFAGDQALAGWLVKQIENDLNYLRIDLDRIARVRRLADEEVLRSQPERHRTRPAATRHPARTDATRRVFLVHGRDGMIADRFKDLLRCVNLQPLEWEELVGASGSTAPYLGQVVASAPHLAQATLVLLSPDDIVELHPDLYQDNDLPYERGRAGQARPNVLFELGLALTAYPERTIVAEVGQMRPIADLGGLNVIHFDGSSQSIKKLLDRLKQAKCPVDDSGTDWLNPERFAGLPTYRRGPAPGQDGQAARGGEGPPGANWPGHE
jgi:predicted nucleotide-binding protein